MEDVLISAVSLLIGALGMRLYLLRPKKFVQEDRNAGLRRYQEWKQGK